MGRTARILEISVFSFLPSLVWKEPFQVDEEAKYSKQPQTPTDLFLEIGLLIIWKTLQKPEISSKISDTWLLVNMLDNQDFKNSDVVKNKNFG